MERELNSTFTEWMLDWLQQNDQSRNVHTHALGVDEHKECLACYMDALGYEPEAERDRRTR